MGANDTPKERAANKAPVSEAQSASNESTGSKQGPQTSLGPPRYVARNNAARSDNTGLLDLVTQADVEQTKRIGALRMMVMETRKPDIVIPPEPTRIPKPKAADYGGLMFSKPFAQLAVDKATYATHEKWEQDRNDIIYMNNQSAAYNDKYCVNSHIDVCDETCKCKARDNPVYLTMLGAYVRAKSGVSGSAVGRQRQPRNTLGK